jgi:ankyrin repeat protein
MTERILERIETLGAVADQQGSTPLHLAAYFNSISTTKLLLKVDKDLAYKKDALGRTPLHIAAHRANYNLMEEICYHVRIVVN